MSEVVEKDAPNMMTALDSGFSTAEAGSSGLGRLPSGVDDDETTEEAWEDGEAAGETIGNKKRRLKQEISKLKHCIEDAHKQMHQNNLKVKSRVEESNKNLVKSTQELVELERLEGEAENQRRETEGKVNEAETRLHQTQHEWEQLEKLREEMVFNLSEAADMEDIARDCLRPLEEIVRGEQNDAEITEKRQKKAEKQLEQAEKQKKKAQDELVKIQEKRKQAIEKRKKEVEEGKKKKTQKRLQEMQKKKKVQKRLQEVQKKKKAAKKRLQEAQKKKVKGNKGKKSDQ